MLARLHRLVALRELGFGLEQIRPIREEELPASELRGMLRMRKAQIEQNLADEQALIRWTKDSGHTLAGPSRELYHHWDDEDPAGRVTELQLLLDPP